jgi:hypothetical protein
MQFDIVHCRISISDFKPVIRLTRDQNGRQDSPLVFHYPRRSSHESKHRMKRDEHDATLAWYQQDKDEVLSSTSLCALL